MGRDKKSSARTAGSVPKPKRFLVLGNGRKPRLSEHAEALCQIIKAAGGIVAGFDLTGRKSTANSRADLAIVLGGDGAILRAAHQMGDRQLPMLGINLGRLGFLADVSPEEFVDVFPQVVAGDYLVTEHVMLDCIVERGRKRQSFRALNDVVISAGPPFQLTSFELTIDGELVAAFSGDGVIVSTPVGSTAHSLAAGGPILAQVLPAVVVTPICPHALTWRSLVESAGRQFTLRSPNASTGTTLIVDGYIQLPITADHVIRFSRAPIDFQLARVRGRSYYAALTKKLHWGAGSRGG